MENTITRYFILYIKVFHEKMAKKGIKVPKTKTYEQLRPPQYIIFN